jgi:hypothetical protein
MKTDDPYKLREKSLEELCKWIGGFNETTSGGKARNILGQHELKRRLERAGAIRSWIAIGISGLALLISDFLISTEFALAYFDDFYDSLYRIFIPVSGWQKFS